MSTDGAPASTRPARENGRGVRGSRRDDVVTLQHGAGGAAMRLLVADALAAGFPPAPEWILGLSEMDDGAVFPLGDGRWLVLTTDSHVVHPLRFPGGDIGRLAVAGTVNDLAVMGGVRPLGITSALVVEEGFPRDELDAIVESMRTTCREAGVTVVTGDTKVMGRGEVDGVVLNTTGVALTRRVVTDRGLRPGDRILLTGSVGDHGVALMARRHGLDFGRDLRSDVAPINGLLAGVVDAVGEELCAMKDPTRGGLASALHEMATKSGVSVILDEPSVPVRPEVRSAAEVLGLDPLQIANEGKAVLGVRPGAVDRALRALREHPLGAEAAVVGRCGEEDPGRVIVDTGLGRRLLTEAVGEPLPRIC